MRAFFTLAAVSPGRRQSLLAMMLCHLAVLAGCLVLAVLGRAAPMVVGQTILVAGIVEGALLVGWRLTQLPKSQALEFMLVTSLRPPYVLWAEALVGLSRLALVTLVGLPMLFVMVAWPIPALDGLGILRIEDIPWMLIQPFIWGAVTGLGLTAWAYESAPVRWWGEKVMMAGIVAYLLIGVLVGENLRHWLSFIPAGFEALILGAFRWFHESNPFGVVKLTMENPAGTMSDREVQLAVMGLAAVAAALGRAAWRLQAHFQELHYRPTFVDEGSRRPSPGDHPLSWWAVKRVTQYSGRINLWLAGGFGLLYSIYVIYQDHWPAWLGRQAFEIFDRMGGIPMLATALVMLAAVPAAFQYGLWDSNVQDRCRRLELLLLTELDPVDYWQAAAAAAWKRGRGYLLIALVLWSAGMVSGQVTVLQLLAALTAAIVLWALYFAVGFWAFMRGHQANVLGLVLTLGLPMATYMLYQLHIPFLAGLLPPGSVYQATAGLPTWLIGPFVGGLLALAIGRWSLAHCDRQLRQWYDANHGLKSVE